MNHMKHALDLAQQAVGLVAPRPAVGTVLVRDDRIVGEGFTQPEPGPHAEIVALRQAGDDARGATLYSTLEPCSHTGATPPCTNAIIAAGVARVVCPTVDPYPAVNGRGFEELRRAGIQVEMEVDAEAAAAARELIEGFTAYVLTGRPLITAKFAMSLDGKIATRTGASQWITGPEARTAAHALRAAADVVMTAIGTVLADDPRLTARDAGGGHVGRPRLRVVVDTDGRLPETARLLREPGDVLWVRGEGASRAFDSPGMEVIDLPRRARGVDLEALVDELGRRGATALLVEGGGTLLGSLFDLGLVDRVAAFIAPIVIGGADAPGPVGGTGADDLAAAARLEHTDVGRLGRDVLITGRIRRDREHR